jgi:Fe(3+) dicitrate transport protein
MSTRSLSLASILALLFFLAAAPASAQSGRITGTVLERSTGEPLEAVNVIIRGTTIGTSTNRDGRFTIERLAPGDHTVVATALGYSVDEKQITVGTTQNVALVFELAPIYLRLPNVEVAGETISIGRSAGAVSVISTTDLRLTSPLGTEEALRKVPGVHISTDDGNSNRANIGIRGTYPRRSERVLLLEDGVPIQPAIYVAPSAYYNPPAERIDAIEIIKNASNARFGANTIGGVINYITHRPPVEPSGTLRLVGGERGYLSSFLTYGGSFADQRFGGEVQLLYSRGDGQRENTSFDIYNVTTKFLFQPAPSTSLSFKGNYHREDAFATYAALTPYMFDVNPRWNPFADDFLATSRYAGDINLKTAFNRNVAFTATAYANHFSRHWWRQATQLVDARTSDATAPEGALIRQGRQENRARLRDFYVYGLTPRLLTDFDVAGLRNETEVGLSIHNEMFFDVEIDTNTPNERPSDFASASTDDPASPFGRKRKNDELGATAVAGFIQNRIARGAFSVTPGLRFERYLQERINRYNLQRREVIFERASKTTVEVLPSVAFMVDTREGSLYGGIHTAFVPLAGSTPYLDLVNDEGVVVNEDLRSERSVNLEIGARSAAHLPIRAEAAFFNNTVSNLIAAGRDAAFVPIIDNLGRVRYSGLETAAVIDAHRIVSLPLEVSLDASFTLMRSNILQGLINESGSPARTDITGNVAPYAPETMYTVGMTLRLPAGLEARTTYSFVGQQFADFNNTVAETAQGDNGLLRSYAFLDATVRYAVPRTGATIKFSGKNLTNEIYRGSRMHRAGSGIFAGGFRQLNLGVELSF